MSVSNEYEPHEFQRLSNYQSLYQYRYQLTIESLKIMNLNLDDIFRDILYFPCNRTKAFESYPCPDI
jgi:hypothetical protein